VGAEQSVVDSAGFGLGASAYSELSGLHPKKATLNQALHLPRCIKKVKLLSKMLQKQWTFICKSSKMAKFGTGRGDQSHKGLVFGTWK
jgi:hypothetical protein